MFCETHKEPFATREDAKQAMKFYRESRRRNVRHRGRDSRRSQHLDRAPVWSRTYLCPHCDAWHLTSQEAH